MNYTESLERIKLLDVPTILKMSPASLERVTCNFNEELINTMLSCFQSHDDQKQLMEKIMSAYKRLSSKSIDGFPVPFSGYPDFMLDLQTDIECRYLVTEKGLIAPPQRMKLTVQCPPYDKNKVVKPKRKTVKAEDKTNGNDNVEEYKRRIAELQAENESLRKQLEECQKHPQTIEMQKKNDDWIVELLAHLCYEDEQVARSILEDVRGKEDFVIVDIIYERKQQKQISQKTQNREIWRILHAAKLYQSTEGNFNTALRRRQQR